MPGTDESPLAGTEVHYLRSEHVGDEFKIFVGHCGTAGGDTTTVDDTAIAPPVLYVGDANGMFASAVEIVRFMQLSAHLPPCWSWASATARAGSTRRWCSARATSRPPTTRNSSASFPPRP